MSPSSSLPSPICSAALQYARRGFTVFPCSAQDKRPLLIKDRDPVSGKPINGTGWRTKQSRDEAQILEWWRKWPDALIGLPTGQDRIFVLDFDPRHDPETGEIFTLEQLKAELVAQMGCELPLSRTAITQSGGVHVWLRWPDDGGEPIRNRGNLPLHVDVRGQGGYVIVPPSVMRSGGRYRWLRERAEPIADAPASLIEILRAPKARQAKDAGGAKPPSSSSSPRPPITGDDASDALIRKYALSALDAECSALAAAPLGDRNNQCNARAFSIGQLVGAAALNEGMARAALVAAVQGFNDPGKAEISIGNGLEAGMAQPRDLSELRERARSSRSRDYRPPAPSAPGPRREDEGSPSFRAEASGGDDGGKGGAGADADALHRRCIFKPHTDLGNAERFHERFGEDFRWSPALGWLGWDGRRWAVLDQDDKSVPAVVLDAVFRTVRAIQDEAKLIEASGFHDEDTNPDGLDQFIIISKNKSTTRARIHAQWGRTSESSGKLQCIANLARPWLAVRADEFDADPYAINVLNGTLFFRRELVDGTWRAEWRFQEAHDRKDLITKLAPVVFDREAKCPIYDEMFAWAQPDKAMRRYLHQWGGLSLTGDMGEQKLHFWYGLGGNGKSTVMDAWAHCAGDYSSTVPIETFLDQGIKKRGDQATPDLARLGGVRLLRTSEPEKGAKLAAALIKLVTGGEPMTVRFLNKGFFDLRPIFKLTISGNHRPAIPETDDGIWRRVKLIPWDQRVRDEMNPNGTREKDPDLPKKLLPEASGIFNRLLAGLLDWLRSGLVEPEAVSAATQQYRNDSDPLARFLKLCTAPKEGGKVQSSTLHALFVAWARAAGENEWSNKGFSNAMLGKGFSKKASDGMWWLGIEMVREPADFIDADGKPIPLTAGDDPPAAGSRAPPAPPPHMDDDDDFPA